MSVSGTEVNFATISGSVVRITEYYLRLIIGVKRPKLQGLHSLIPAGKVYNIRMFLPHMELYIGDDAFERSRVITDFAGFNGLYTLVFCTFCFWRFRPVMRSLNENSIVIVFSG
jgi:hypothetical protein